MNATIERVLFKLEHAEGLRNASWYFLPKENLYEYYCSFSYKKIPVCMYDTVRGFNPTGDEFIASLHIIDQGDTFKTFTSLISKSFKAENIDIGRRTLFPRGSVFKTLHKDDEVWYTTPGIILDKDKVELFGMYFTLEQLKLAGFNKDGHAQRLTIGKINGSIDVNSSIFSSKTLVSKGIRDILIPYYAQKEWKINIVTSSEPFIKTPEAPLILESFSKDVNDFIHNNKEVIWKNILGIG